MSTTQTDAEPFVEFEVSGFLKELYLPGVENNPTAADAMTFRLQASKDFKFSRALFLKLKSLPDKGPQGPIPADADL
jgi:hypothetical protein